MATKFIEISAWIFKRTFHAYWLEFVNILEKTILFLSVSSLSVGISGFFATFIAYSLLGVPVRIDICIAVFLMAFSLYSINKITDIKEDAINIPERLSFIKGRGELILAYSISAYMLCIIMTFLDSPSSALLCFIPLVANALYGSRLLPGLPRLKDIPVMKNVVVAVSWAITLTFLPAAHIMYERSTIALVFFFMLIKAFVNTVLYDLRDVKGDKENKIKTLPVILGTERTVLMLLAFNSALFPLLIIFTGSAWTLTAMLILNGFACILYFGENMNKLAMDVFVDGEWTLISIIFILFCKAGLMV